MVTQARQPGEPGILRSWRRNSFIFVTFHHGRGDEPEPPFHCAISNKSQLPFHAEYIARVAIRFRVSVASPRPPTTSRVNPSPSKNCFCSRGCSAARDDGPSVGPDMRGPSPLFPRSAEGRTTSVPYTPGSARRATTCSPRFTTTVNSADPASSSSAAAAIATRSSPSSPPSSSRGKIRPCSSSRRAAHDVVGECHPTPPSPMHPSTGIRR